MALTSPKLDHPDLEREEAEWGGDHYEIFRLNNVDLETLLYQYVDSSQTGAFDDGEGSEADSDMGDALHSISLLNLEGSDLEPESRGSSPLSSCPPTPPENLVKGKYFPLLCNL